MVSSTIVLFHKIIHNIFTKIFGLHLKLIIIFSQRYFVCEIRNVVDWTLQWVKGKDKEDEFCIVWVSLFN